MQKYALAMFAVACGLSLSGCGSTIKQKPTAQLCMDYMTYPSANIWQSERAAELAKRGADCNPYLGIAAARRDADRDFQSALGTLANTGSGVTTIAPLPNTPSTRTYILNGKYVTCTTTGTITNCI